MKGKGKVTHHPLPPSYAPQQPAYAAPQPPAPSFFEQYQQQGKRPRQLRHRPTLHMWHEVRRGLQLPPVLSNCQSVLQERFTGRNLWIIGTRTLAG